MKFDRQKFYRAYHEHFGSLTQEQVDGLNCLLDQVDADEAWRSIDHIAYFLATVAHETAHTFRPIKEYRARVGTKGRKNQDRYWPSGYYGRGYVQITWERNYQLATRKLSAMGYDLVANPSLALEPEVAYQVAARGMREGWFTGRKLSDYITAVHADYFNARQIINGHDGGDFLAAVARRFEGVLRVAYVAPTGEANTAAITTEGAAEDEQKELEQQVQRSESSEAETTTATQPSAPAAVAPPMPPAQPTTTVETVQRVAQSWQSKATAWWPMVSAPVLAGWAAFRGLPAWAQVAFVAVGFAVGAWLWNESKKRQAAEQHKLIEAAASTEKNTVVIAPPPAKAG